MKRTTILTASIVALGVTPVMAADFATKAAPLPYAAAVSNWTGLYLGINGGGAWSNSCWTMNGAFVVGFPSRSEGCYSESGAVLGGQIGYRYQWGALVFGIEAQGDWANVSASGASAVFGGINARIAPASINLVNTAKIDGIGLFTGQVGYAVTSSLLGYVKGGFAVTDNQYSGALAITGLRGRGVAPTLGLADSASAANFGEVLGLGAEYKFMGNWSVAFEYDHLFMNTVQPGFALTNASPFTRGGLANLNALGAGSPSRNDSISGDVDMATLKVNYHFAP